MKTISAFQAELNQATVLFDQKLDFDVAKLLNNPLTTIAVAESMTGGLLGERLTRIPGSSRYFIGGIVCYSPLIKIRLCGVLPATLSRYTAVSREVAQEMVNGVQSLMKSDVGVSVTGYSGPGHSEESPVGTVFIGLKIKQNFEKVQGFQFSGKRAEVRAKAAQAALVMVRQWLGTYHSKYEQEETDDGRE